MLATRFLAVGELDNNILRGLFASTMHTNEPYAGFIGRISEGLLKVFVVGAAESACYMAVSVVESYGVRELVLDALWVQNPKQGWRFRTYLEFLKKLGAEWDCTKVGTAIVNPRQLKGLLKNGCKVDYVAVSLEIGNGQQENNHTKH